MLYLSFKFYKYLYEEIFLTPDFSWAMNSTNRTSLALPFTLLPHSIYFVVKKFGRKHWAHEHDCFCTPFPLSLSSKPVSVSLSILIFSFLSPRNWSVSQVCRVLGCPAHSASFQSRCLKVWVAFDQIAGWSLSNGSCLFSLIVFFPTLFQSLSGEGGSSLFPQEAQGLQTIHRLLLCTGARIASRKQCIYHISLLSCPTLKTCSIIYV